MRIIIEIPESEIPKQQDFIEIPLHFIHGEVCEAGGYGFCVLPKRHGRIIDESQITGTFTWDNGFIECFAPTIIEADKEGGKCR